MMEFPLNAWRKLFTFVNVTASDSLGLINTAIVFRASSTNFDLRWAKKKQTRHYLVVVVVFACLEEILLHACMHVCAYKRFRAAWYVFDDVFRNLC